MDAARDAGACRGQPALLKSSQGIALSAEQIPQGSPNVLVTQLRVKAT